MESNYKVGIVGCGKIFNRHYEAIQFNENYELVAICDVDVSKKDQYSNLSVPFYENYHDMIDNEDVNLVVIATPNSLHFDQAMYAITNGCDVLIEKPVGLSSYDCVVLSYEAEKNNQRAYCVLQVRLNPVIRFLKSLVKDKVIGEIRGVSLVQRWQRPNEYFDDWRGTPNVGGGILHECGIHYLDIMCDIFGKPNVKYSTTYNTKHKGRAIEDTVYAILNYGQYGGTLEVNISSEPKNIECTMSVLTDKGYIKLGGKALEKITDYEFSDDNINKLISESIETFTDTKTPNSYVKYSGSCPNHPELYRNIEDFDVLKSYEVLCLIEEIYRRCGKKY